MFGHPRFVEQVCFWLGEEVNGKIEFGQRFDLLGVSLDCVTRKDNLERELPGAAAKLRDELHFVAGRFASRHGRALLHPLQKDSTRQAKTAHFRGHWTVLYVHGFTSWLQIQGRAPLYAPVVPETADVVLLTDGASRCKGVAPRYDVALLGLGGVLEELWGR